MSLDVLRDVEPLLNGRAPNAGDAAVGVFRAVLDRTATRCQRGEMSSDDLREGLERHRGPVVYSDLAAHLKRDAVFVVAQSVDLVTCGLAIARDDRAAVERWITSGELRRPTPDELAEWPSDEGRTWISVVVQPYVLLQDPPPDA